MFPGLSLGVGVLVAGLLLVLIIWLLLRILPKLQPSVQSNAADLVYPDPELSDDGVLVLRPGGRVEYLNHSARTFFGLRENEPFIDLEHLASRVRSSTEFLSICASPGQARVMINGRLVQATSYQVPGFYPVMLIAMHALDLSPAAAQAGESAGAMIKIVTDLSQSFAAGLDLASTVKSILENIRRLLPAEFLELKLWDAEEQAFTGYCLKEGTGSLHLQRAPEVAGERATSPRSEMRANPIHERASLPRLGDTAGRILLVDRSPFIHLTHQLIAGREPLLLTGEQLTSGAGGNGSSPLMRSYLGVPLSVDGQIVGLLEAGQISGTGFNQHNLEIIQLVSNQAALAIRNAMSYEKETRRATELSGLTDLFHSISSYQSQEELITRIVEIFAPLFSTEIFGIILFDEDRRTLEGKVPFAGLQAHFVQIYRASIPPGSPAEQVLLNHEPIVTLNAAEDSHWRVLGLNDIAIAASLRDSAMMPMISGDKTLGYLQVAHHRQGPAPFTRTELRLLKDAAEQAATAIANYDLLQQARRRGRRAEAFRRLSALTASTKAVEEIMGASINELAQLFEAETGAIILLNETQGSLQLWPEASYGVSERSLEFFAPISLDDPAYRSTSTSSQHSFISGQISSERNELPLYASVINSLQLESILIAPMVVRGRSVGEIMLGSPQAEHFDHSDMDFLNGTAAQLAALVESGDLQSQTDPDLRKHLDQLTTVARISRELGASLDVGHVLEVIHGECKQATQADCAALLLFDQRSQPADLNPEIVIGCAEGREITEFERTAFNRNEPLIIANFAQEGHNPPHPGVVSALLVPILNKGGIVGAIHLHSNSPDHFTADMAGLIQNLAAQASNALINSQRFQVEQLNSVIQKRRAATLGALAQTNSMLSEEQPIDQALTVIATAIREASPFRVVLVSLYEPENGLMQRVSAVGIPAETMTELLARKQPLAGLQHLMQPQFKIGHSYFIPADQTPILPAEVHYVYSTYESPGSAPKANAWDPDDFLLFPVEDAQGQMLGLISVDDPSDGLRPDRATIESIEAFCMQAAFVITKHNQLSALREQVDSLNSGLQRQQKLLNVTQNDLPVLLRKDLEQTISLHNLDQRTQRVRAGLAITEQVSRQLDGNSALLALGRETLTQLGMSAAMVAENSPDGPRLLHTLGSVPRSTNVDALFGQRNPLRSSLQSGEPILVSNLDDDEEWRDSPLLTSLRAKGMICLPVRVQEKPVAAMLAISPEPLPPFTEEDRQVYLQIARQSSVILHNISLLNETRRRLQEVNLLLDFSRRLSGLDTDAILKALLDSAQRVLPNAHAGIVLVWNQQAGSLIPLVASGYVDNDSMASISYRSGEALPGITYAEKRGRRVDEINFARDFALNAENLTIYRQAAGGRLPVSSMLIPILTGDQCLGVLVLDNFNTPAAFKPEDETLLISLTQQVALSFENVRLMQAMRERAGQLQALNDVATSLTSSLRSDQLVSTLLDQLIPVLPFDTAAFWLRDRDRLTVAAARGFPEMEKLLGQSIAVPDSALFNQMAQTGQVISVGDVREDARFPRLEAPRLSWLGIPLISKGVLAGVLALEKWQAHFYTNEQIQVGFTFASQAAVALENARLYEDSLNRAEELDERSQRLSLLNRFSSSLSGLLDTDQILQLAAEELLKAVGADRVAVVTFDRNQAIWKAAVPRLRIDLPRLLPDAPIFQHLRESLGVFNTDDARTEEDVAPLRDMLGQDTTALMVISIPSGQNLVGLMFAQASGVAHFSPVEIELARTIINQVAISLDNARLYQSSVQTAKRLAILNETSSQVSAHLDPEDIYLAVHKAAERLMPVDSFAIGILDESLNEIEGVYLMDRNRRSIPVRIPRNQGLSGRVISSGQALLLHDEAVIQSSGGAAFGKVEGVLSFLAVPMVLGGKVHGLLCAQSYKPDVYTSDDQQIMETLANQAIVALQNARLFAETQRLAEELEGRVVERTALLQHEQQNTETLLRILTEVSSSLDLDRALHRTLALLNDAIGAEQGTIMLLHSEDNLLHYRAGYGYLSERAEPELRELTLKIGEDLAGWVVFHREAALVGDLHADPRWVQSPASRDHRSSIIIPMIVGEDVIGVLMVFHRSPNYFNSEMQSLVKAIAGQVAVAINNAHLYELIRDQAERLGVMLRKEQEDASRSQAILAAVADGVLVTGADNKISFINSSIEHILRLNKSSLMGNSLDSFAGLFGKAAGSWMETIRRWSEDPTIYQTGDTYAEQLELEGGRIALVHLAPVIMQNDFLGTVSIFRDITQQVEVDRLKSEFVATVSHELRTPMTSIKGYVDLLQMGAAGAMNENQEHFIEIVSNNINRLNLLLDELLDISRFESGNVVFTPGSVDLGPLAEEIVAKTLARAQKENKPMTITLEAPEDLPAILGDEQHVRTIFSHLVDNAYNYTPENGSIKVRIQPQAGKDVQVDIQDSGVGIPLDNQDRIFERFWRGEDPMVLATPGTGLGLPIVRQLVEMHNGKVWLTSSGTPGEGCTFSFTLPRYVTKDKKADMHTAPLFGDEKDLIIPPKDPPLDPNRTRNA